AGLSHIEPLSSGRAVHADCQRAEHALARGRQAAHRLRPLASAAGAWRAPHAGGRWIYHGPSVLPELVGSRSACRKPLGRQRHASRPCTVSDGNDGRLARDEVRAAHSRYRWKEVRRIVLERIRIVDRPGLLLSVRRICKAAAATDRHDDAVDMLTLD